MDLEIQKKTKSKEEEKTERLSLGQERNGGIGTCVDGCMKRSMKEEQSKTDVCV